MNELEEILQRASRTLSAEEMTKLRALVETFQWLQGEISRKDASIGRLRKLMFGTPTTEKTSQVLGESPKKETAKEEGEESDEPPQAASTPSKGHGRKGAEDYSAAPRVSVKHETLKPGDPCPEEGCDGKLYRLAEPRMLVCVKGHAPLLSLA